MRINSNGIPPNVLTEQAKAEKISPQSVKAGAQTSATVSLDTVSISALAAKALESPEIRQDKVDAIRQQLADGTYKVDSSRIADAILKESSGK